MRAETYDNIEVFKDTMKMCKENAELKSHIDVSKEIQKVYHENDMLMRYMASACKPVNITITANRTFQAAQKYDTGRTAVLNFADFYKPGGLVEVGSKAQEESLCRISTLYPCITDDRMIKEFYKPHKEGKFNSLYNNDIIYTPSVAVFKNDGVEMNVLDRDDWYSVDVITCAAPNLRGVTISDELLFEIQKSRFGRILAVADHNGVQNLVLGAFGCGAFKNDPKIVAKAAKAAIEEHNNSFGHGYTSMIKNIEFAVYCTAADTSNYIAFKECFEDQLQEAELDGEIEEGARSFTSDNFEERSNEEDFEYDSADGEISDFEYDPFD